MGGTWSKGFPGQPEIERWLHYIAKRLDLRREALRAGLIRLLAVRLSRAAVADLP